MKAGGLKRQARQSGGVGRKLLIGLGVFLSLLVLFVVYQYWMLQRVRAKWMETDLPKLAILTTNDPVIQRDLNYIFNPTPNVNFGWTGEHVLMMTNEEYLIYEFRHGYNIGTLDHLFLAHGSNGRWYYSTYHFCSQMAGVRGDDPPGSIAEFTNRYSVREFDGKSKVCLSHTWP